MTPGGFSCTPQTKNAPLFKYNRDFQNLKRVDEYFVEGEVVMFYNRLIGSEGDPSKLRLRTYLYLISSLVARE